MSITLSTDSFNRGLDRWMQQFNVSADAAMRHIASKLFENIVRRTPVDTGWARANWYASLNAKIDPPSGGAPDGTTGLPPAEPGPVVARGKAGDVFWLQNGVPYIKNLENGSSDQAAEGMVKLSIAEAETFFRGWAMEVGRIK